MPTHVTSVVARHAAWHSARVDGFGGTPVLVEAHRSSKRDSKFTQPMLAEDVVVAVHALLGSLVLVEAVEEAEAVVAVAAVAVVVVVIASNRRVL